MATLNTHTHTQTHTQVVVVVVVMIMLLRLAFSMCGAGDTFARLCSGVKRLAPAHVLTLKKMNNIPPIAESVVGVGVGFRHSWLVLPGWLARIQFSICLS